MAKRHDILAAGTTGLKSWQSLRKWDSEKHRIWNMPVVGFENHVASDGSLFGVSGRWSACGWSVARPEHDEEMEPTQGMHYIFWMMILRYSAPPRGQI